MVGIVQRRYAKALYELAADHNKADLIAGEIETVKKIIYGEKDFMKVLCHPYINEEEKISIVKNIFEGKISQELLGMIILVINKNRQVILGRILDEYIKILKNKKNIVTAIITSAFELSDEYKQKIYKKLKQSLNKEIEIQTNIDKEMLGGLKIQVDNTVFDRTVVSRIEKLRQAL